MDQFNKPRNKSHFHYSGGEPIGNKGCLFLTQTFMPQLRKLGLVNCNIEEPGMHHLSKKQWKRLT